MWENIYAIMTDAVSKNLKVEIEVAHRLNSNHIPIHILCKSHTCEKLDEACINALVHAEKKIDYAKLLIAYQPQLKSFIRRKKCVALAALEALLKLVAREESAKPTSLAKEFDLQLEEDGVAKSMSLYKERRFTKLGHSAGSIVDCLPQYEKILENTSLNNQLVQACKCYIDSDYIKAAFRALANFTYYITMPFLNAVEKCDQNELMPLLVQLHSDLLAGKMDTLDPFHVPWTHVNMQKQKPTTALDHLLLKNMCSEAAKGLFLQCTGEYWLESENPRATQLHRLTEEERRNVPTENMSCERYLAQFGNLASISAVRRNNFFKAKRIRDYLMFGQGEGEWKNEATVSRSATEIIKTLQSMEGCWNQKQTDVWKEKIKSSLQKKVRSAQYKDVLLKRCKDHGGPLLSAEDVANHIQKNNDKKKLKGELRAEVGLQKALHPFDARERPHLYKMNFLSVDMLTENIVILLDKSEEDVAKDEVVFPSEEEIYDKINEEDEKDEDEDKTVQSGHLNPDEPLAVIWDDDDGTRYWCIGFYAHDNEDETIQIDHLTQKQKGSCVQWIRPTVDDLQSVQPIQLLPMKIEGHWDLSSERRPSFIIDNLADIESFFKNNYLG